MKTPEELLSGFVEATPSLKKAIQDNPDIQHRVAAVFFAGVGAGLTEAVKALANKGSAGMASEALVLSHELVQAARAALEATPDEEDVAEPSRH